MKNLLVFIISTYIFIPVGSTGLTEAKKVSCNKTIFEDSVNTKCILPYNKSMESVPYTDRCPWPTAKVSYIKLNECVAKIILHTKCVEPSLKDKIFIEIHRTYFFLCSNRYREDPELNTLLLLILPCIITTLLLPFLPVL